MAPYIGAACRAFRQTRGHLKNLDTKPHHQFNLLNLRDRENVTCKVRWVGCLAPWRAAGRSGRPASTPCSRTCLGGQRSTRHRRRRSRNWIQWKDSVNSLNKFDFVLGSAGYFTGYTVPGSSDKRPRKKRQNKHQPDRASCSQQLGCTVSSSHLRTKLLLLAKSTTSLSSTASSSVKANANQAASALNPSDPNYFGSPYRDRFRHALFPSSPCIWPSEKLF